LTERFPESLPSAYNARFMEETQFTPRLTPLHEDVVGGAARVLWILLGGVAIVLVITCANVANLFLVRAETRRKEMAVRSVLGAGRADLARHRLSETLLISCLACVLGVGVAWSGMRLLVQAAPAGIPRLSEISLRMPALLFALGVSLVLGVVFGVAPSRRGAPVLDLADMSRGTTPSARRRAVRNGLIVAQVALCFALLAGAGLLLRSFDRLTDVEPGFSPDGVLTFRVVLPYDRYPDADRSTTFDRILSERIEDLPGVVAVGAGASVPLGGVGGCTTVLPLAPARADQKSECLYPEYITPGYFRALDIPVQGHEPTWSEIQAGARVAVISASMARRFWGDTNVLGREIRVPDGFAEAYRIVGVVDDIRNEALDAPSLETIYVPLFPAPPWGRLGGPAFFVKTDLENPTTLVPAIRQALAELDASVPLVRPQSMHTIVVTSMGRLTFTATLLSVAAFMALMVGTVGIYGVVSYTVSQRRAEIGVRVALGAQGTQVRRMIIVETLRVALFGIVAGLLVALPLGRTLESLLYGVSPADPLTLGIVAVALLLVAAAAGWAPATLALRVDPLEALRSG
jgi:predicted permease